MMTPERKIRSLIFAIAFLLITNIILLLFLIFSRNNDDKPHNHDLSIVGSFLQDSIGFDKKQMDLYQNVRKEDFEKGKAVFDSMKFAKNKFYENIYTNNVSDSVINKLALNIAEKQVAVDKHMLHHFKNLRNLCTARQLPRFDSLFNNVVEKVTSGRFRSKKS